MARVLVVDDDRAIRELLCFALQCEGYDVTTLTTGEGVVEALAEAAAPMVVLMDLMMPRMNGWEVCARLTAAPGALAGHALVVMTASMLDGDECPAPARVLLRKPFMLDEVYGLVSALFAEFTIAEAIGQPPDEAVAMLS
jgi:CheY-like chemotaxis protein